MRKFAIISAASVAAFANAKNTTAADTTTTVAGRTVVAPELTDVVSIDLPETAIRRAGRAGGSSYPFDSLEVGQAFGVKNKDKRSMSSIVSNQNKKFRVQSKDANGNLVYGTKKLADGTEVPDTSKPKWGEPTKKFETVEVTPAVAEAIKGVDALAGAKVLVRRVK